MELSNEIKQEKFKVSIIIPMYNAIDLINQTILSVQKQLYHNWEVIIVDDCSIDGSFERVNQLKSNDPRIYCYQLDKNSGPGAATRFGFEKSTGDYIAFIDSDDLWYPDKLSKQLDFMITNGYDFCCTDYEQIDFQGKRLGRIIKCKPIASYKTVLFFNPIGSSTVIISRTLLSAVLIPTIRKRNDYSLWLALLHKGQRIYGLNSILMQYRICPKSISRKKSNLVKYHWMVYRQYEHLPVLLSALLIVWWVLIKMFRIK